MKIQQGFVVAKSGSWLGCYSKWVRDPADPSKRKRVQKAYKIAPVKGMTKTKAKEILRKRVSQECGVTADGRMKFSEFVERQWWPINEGAWRDSTKAVNKELLKPVLDHFGATAVESLDEVEMQSWLNEMAKKYSTSRVVHCRIFLRSITALAHRKELLRVDTGLELELPNPDNMKKVKKDFLSIEEMGLLLGPQEGEDTSKFSRGQKAARNLAKRFWGVSTQDRAILVLMFRIGLRPSELFAAKWKFYDGENLHIAETTYRGVTRRFTKTTSEGADENVTNYVPKSAQLALAKWREQSAHTGPDDYIFTNSQGGMINKNNYLKRILKPLAKSVGITKTVNFQTIRRTCATWADDESTPKTVAAILRHRSTETAQRHYVQTIDQSVVEAQERLSEKLPR